MGVNQLLSMLVFFLTAPERLRFNVLEAHFIVMLLEGNYGS